MSRLWFGGQVFVEGDEERTNVVVRGVSDYDAESGGVRWDGHSTGIVQAVLPDALINGWF
jgi:hypothetical protein